MASPSLTQAPSAGPPRPLRVALVIQSYPPVLGGAQRQVQRLGPLLHECGVDGTVVTRRPPGTPAREREPGLEVLRLSGPRAPGAASIAYVARGVAALLGARPDVIHVFDLLSPATIGLIAAAPLRVPIVAKVLSASRGGDVDRLLHKPLGAARLRLLSRRVAAFHTLSDEVEAELVEHGVPRERFARIPNGVDARRFRPPTPDERRRERSALGIGDDELVTLYCGRLAPVKRLDVLLDAFRELPGRLVIAGDGSEEQRLRELAATPGLDGRVDLRATVDDPAPLYRCADVYATASMTEGMSGSVLEAMASGLPVVASPASGMAELVRPDTGVLAPDASADALRTALAPLALDAAVRERLGRAAREVVARDYSLEATATRLAALYRQLAGVAA